MSLDLTRAEVMDRAAKCKSRPSSAQVVLVVVALLLFAATFGYAVPYPIRGY